MKPALFSLVSLTVGAGTSGSVCFEVLLLGSLLCGSDFSCGLKKVRMQQ